MNFPVVFFVYHRQRTPLETSFVFISNVQFEPEHDVIVMIRRAFSQESLSESSGIFQEAVLSLTWWMCNSPDYLLQKFQLL